MDERDQQHCPSVIRHAEEICGNVATTCRYYGISRPTFYKWLRQFEEFGEDGLRRMLAILVARDVVRIIREATGRRIGRVGDASATETVVSGLRTISTLRVTPAVR